MAIKALVEKIEDVPEALREHYKERDGKFILDVQASGGFELGEVDGLKTALGAERGVNEKMRRELERFGSTWDKDKKAWVHTLDPDKAKAAIIELDELKAIDPTKEADKIANGKFESAKAQLLEQHTRELGEKDNRIKVLAGVVDGALRRQEAVKAIADGKGSVDLLLPHVLAHTRLTETDGKFGVEVIDAAGNPRIVNGKGDAMTIAGLVAEMRESETFARAFDGDGHSGTGKQHDDSGNSLIKGNVGGSHEERAAHFAKKFKL